MQRRKLVYKKKLENKILANLSIALTSLLWQTFNFTLIGHSIRSIEWAYFVHHSNAKMEVFPCISFLFSHFSCSCFEVHALGSNDLMEYLFLEHSNCLWSFFYCYRCCKRLWAHTEITQILQKVTENVTKLKWPNIQYASIENMKCKWLSNSFYNSRNISAKLILAVICYLKCCRLIDHIYHDIY